MSLFLGKIHYWLYNKIIWAEKVEADIVSWAKTQGIAADQWIQQFQKEYGQPTGDRPLEEVIDTSNIHGWLQERIRSAELRQAALVTAILAENSHLKTSLIEIFKRQGQTAASEYGVHPDTPEGLFNALNDFILEGMPCDRAYEVTLNNENEIIWEIADCLHKPYWSQVGGDIKNFYDMREAWTASFIEVLNPEFRYVKIRDGEYSISKKSNEE